MHGSLTPAGLSSLVLLQLNAPELFNNLLDMEISQSIAQKGSNRNEFYHYSL